MITEIAIAPKENHFFACSPFQIIKYPYQLKLKTIRLFRLFSRLDYFYPSEHFFGYRKKIEFSFKEENKKLFLAFFRPNERFKKIALKKGCLLASPKMNEIALVILEKLNFYGVLENQVKSLVILESKTKKENLAVLYVKEKNWNHFFVPPIPSLKGFLIIYSDPRSPASVTTKVLFQYGKNFLEEKILGFRFLYSYDSFFQAHLSLFEKAIEEMKKSLNFHSLIIDLYCGVGVIGICLHSKAKKVIGVEVNPSAIEYARKNKEINKIENYFPLLAKAEKIDQEIIQKAEVLILDPPRSGLHPKLIKMILASPPFKIIYLSCNPQTQAKNYKVLREKYFLKKVIGFDFFPHTPHLESLIVLERK